MSGVNKVIILGRIGKEPEVRDLNGGSKVATFSVATSEKYKDKNGDWQEKTEWHNIVAWGKLAGLIQNHFNKGSEIYLEGKIATRSWDDKEGNKRYTTEIIMANLCFTKGSKVGEGQQRDEHHTINSTPNQQEESTFSNENEEDLPF